MKKTFLFLFILITCSLYWSCRKVTYDEALPAVQFISARSYGNDSVLLTAKVTNSGASPIENVGFAFDEQPYFDILVNQVQATPTTGQFSVVIKAMADSTYYIKCFATNSFGYVASGNYKYTVPTSIPQYAPCVSSIPANSVVDAKVTYSNLYIYYNNAGSTYGNIDVNASNGSSESVDIYFNAPPVNGVYTTSDPTNLSFDPNPYDCAIVVNNNYVVNSGGYVYIALGTGGSGTITFCSLPYVAFSSTFFVSGNLTY
jgi:hypothetical protein